MIDVFDDVFFAYSLRTYVHIFLKILIKFGQEYNSLCFYSNSIKDCLYNDNEKDEKEKVLVKTYNLA